MLSYHFRDKIVNSFTIFCHAKYYAEADYPKSLVDYIFEWISHGVGIDATGGNYQYFLEAVITIADAYQRDPSIIYYQKEGYQEVRTIEGLFDFTDDWFDVFDRQAYELIAYQHVNGDRAR